MGEHLSHLQEGTLMSTFATTWAWEQIDLDAPEKLTLLALAEGANHQGQCWPAKALMMRMTGLTDTVLATVLGSLESKAVLRRAPQSSGPPIVFLRLDRASSVIQPPRQEVVAFVPSEDIAADIELAIAAWNEMAARTAQGNPGHKLAAVRKLNDANKKHLAARLKEFGLEGWISCVSAIEQSAHCRGVNDRGWRADISYLLQPKGSNKTINGGWPADYEEKTNGGQRTGPTGRGDERSDRLRSFDAATRRRLDPLDGRQGGGPEDRG